MAAFRVDVGRNWDTARCTASVLATGGLYKPTTDPRTAAEFARDNWSFCQKEFVQAGLRTAAEIPKDLADAEAGLSTIMQEVANVVSDVFFNIWKFCYEAYSTFMDKMKGAAKLFHNFMIQLHSIVGRLQAAALSIVFGLIALISAFISATQLILIVAIIIIGILIALQIILFFILLPISGLIITITALVSVVVVSVATAIAAAMVAELFTPGACFAAGTMVVTETGSAIPIETVRIGQALWPNDSNYVTAVHRFNTIESLWVLDGVRVTGDHLIGGCRVRDHPEAVPSPESARLTDLWCLTTARRQIPVKGLHGRRIFADWEEIEDDDRPALENWYRAVWRTLNRTQEPAPRLSARAVSSDAGLSPDCMVPVAGFFGYRKLRRVMDIRIGDRLYTRDGGLTRVVGIVEIAGNQITDAVELPDPTIEDTLLVSIGSWIRHRESSLWTQPVTMRCEDLHPMRWIHLYTAAGEFQVGSGEWSIRDASDVGLAVIGDLVDDVILDPKKDITI